MPPIVSVITAVYNAEGFIAKTLGSILRQSFSDFEYILVDDGSSDKSAALIESCGDPRVRLIRNERNERLVYTRNRAIAAATGQFIAVTDHDDVSLPTRFAEQVAFLQAHPEVGLVGSWYNVIDENDRYIYHPARRRYSPDAFRASLLFRNPIAHSTVMIRRDALPNPPYALEYPLCEDYFLIVQIARNYEIALIPKVLVQYRAVRASYTNKARPQMQALGRTLKSGLLQALGIEVTGDEIALHDNLSTRTVAPTTELLERTELWLERLVAANDARRVYEPMAFRSVVGNEWFELCREASFLGPEIWQRYRRSHLGRHSQYGSLEHLRLLQKCLLPGFGRDWRNFIGSRRGVLDES